MPEIIRPAAQSIGAIPLLETMSPPLSLKKALITYTESGGQGDPTFDTEQAIAVMLEKHGITCDMMHGFNWDEGVRAPCKRAARA